MEKPDFLVEICRVKFPVVDGTAGLVSAPLLFQRAQLCEIWDGDHLLRCFSKKYFNNDTSNY